MQAIPVTSVIDKHYQAFTSDPEYGACLKRIDKTKLHKGTQDLKENIAILVNYHVFSRHLRAMKIVRGRMSDVAESNLVARGKEALEVYQRISDSFHAIEGACTASGFGKLIEKHIGNLCAHLDHNPKILAMMNEFEIMGLTKAEIACAQEELRQHDFNLLRYGGADGTFSGFMRHAASMKPAMEKELQLIEQHGLPTITGAGGGSGASTGVIVGIVVVAAVLCIVTVFYA